MVRLPEPPQGWADDAITEYIDNTRINSFLTFAKSRAEYVKLAEIDKVFRRLIYNLVNTQDWFVAFFLLRAHSAFLTAVHLAMSGQAVETYASLRLSLEFGLYGLYLSRNPVSQGTWLRRHDEEAAKKRVRDEFRIEKLFATLRKCDATEAKIAKDLYEHCIDYGAHPNERALTQCLRTEAGPEVVNFQIIYLSADPLVLQLCLRTAAQVGVAVLGIFRVVFRERFDLIGLTEELSLARQGL